MPAVLATAIILLGFEFDKNKSKKAAHHEAAFFMPKQEVQILRPWNGRASVPTPNI